jgi:REP element-mobilizing transposase RayT
MPHQIPVWVPEHSRYFITINCQQRGEDILGQNGHAKRLLDSIQIYESLNKWRIFLMLVMPDHVHIIGSFNHTIGTQPVISSWKGYHARVHKNRMAMRFF